MKQTRLELVQKVLSALNEDNISAIGDSEVSVQVAALLDIAYNDLLAQYPWPFLFEATSLEATSTAHIMRVPDDVFQVNWIKYNKEDVQFITYKEMTDKLDARDVTSSDVDTYGALNDQAPKYWTSLDEENIIFDAYDGSLVSALSKVEIVQMPAELVLDNQYPVIPARFVPVLMYDIKAKAFGELDGDDSKEAYYTRAHKTALAQMKSWGEKIAPNKRTFFNLINYARRSRIKHVRVVDA